MVTRLGVGWIQKREVEQRDYTSFESEWWAFLIWVIRWYPDKGCDLFRDEYADYANEEIMQRLMMRAYARNADVAFTGTRGITKTSTKFKYAMLNGLVWPGTQSAYYGPSYKQMALIGSKQFKQIAHDYPALAKGWRVTAESKDDFKIETDLGSAFYISAFRGDNIHDVTAEEFAQEENPPFDFTEYSTIVLPAVRLRHNVDGKPDQNFVSYKNHSITSAGRKQHPSFQVRCDTLKEMYRGESAFAYDMSWECVVLQQMRPYSWALKLKSKLTPERWMREMESRYTGADEYPIISDESLSESCCLQSMERQHCCKYPGNKTDPKNVIYIVCYDVSYEDAKKNAKCAVGVWKLTKQDDFLKRDRYLKQLVWLDDWPPPDNAMKQARKLKDVWYRFCFDGGNTTYIAIDGWQYGKAVIEDLMKDLGDGLPPLCILDHTEYVALEQDGALPIIYPIKAGGSGVTDPDVEMIRYAQTQFDNHNVQLLTMNTREGVEAYKRLHKIKDDDLDYQIARPYQKTRELSGQIQNLKAVPSGAGFSEKRISRAIQRDSWSAIKYGLRLAQKLEKELVLSEVRKKSDWDALLSKYKAKGNVKNVTGGSTGARLVTQRRGGRIF